MTKASRSRRQPWQSTSTRSPAFPCTKLLSKESPPETSEASTATTTFCSGRLPKRRSPKPWARPPVRDLAEYYCRCFGRAGESRPTQAYRPAHTLVRRPLAAPVSRKMRRHKRNEALCCRLFQYLFGAGITDEVDREELRADFARERRIDDNNAIDLSGDTVALDEVRLPTPWR